MSPSTRESRRENRREERRVADGAVRVWFQNPQRLEIEGRLMDISASGFRMAHDYAPLSAGQIVEFSHIESTGRARVIWNRISDAHVETGFLVLSGAGPRPAIVPTAAPLR